MEESDILYKKRVALDSFRYRVFRNLLLLIFALVCFLFFSQLKYTDRENSYFEGSCIFAIVLFLLFIPVILFDEKKKTTEISIYYDKIDIEYLLYNQRIIENINPISLKIKLYRRVSRSGTNYIIELLAKNNKYKIETDKNWTKENIKQI